MREIQYQQLAEPVFVPAAPVDTSIGQIGWYQPWPEQWIPNKRLVYDAFAEPTFRPPDLPFGWYAAWPEPIRLQKPNQDWFAAPVFVPTAIVIPPLGWFLEWSGPVQPKKYGQDSYASPVFAQPAPNYGWWTPWSEPIRFQRLNQADWHVEPIFVTPPPLSWLLQWSEPIRFVRNDRDFIASPVFTPPPPVVPTFGWFTEWDRPIFRRFPNQDNFWDYTPLTGLPSFVPDPCVQNPIPLPNGMTVFQQTLQGGFSRLVHIVDGNQIQVRSDYALWCCKCGAFVPRSEVAINLIGFPESFKGIF